jgi:cation-transporting ATPase 13A1
MFEMLAADAPCDGVRSLRGLLFRVAVWARMDPTLKESVVRLYATEGRYVMMCGDGTNDVGALKAAHVGVALLNGALDAKTAGTPTSPAGAGAAATPGRLGGARRRAGAAGGSPAAPTTGAAVAPAPASFKELSERLQEQVVANAVKMGDASIAAPFAAKGSSISAVVDIVRQGRCTLVTTNQMFAILALNSLLHAFTYSALYLKGVRFSEVQTTVSTLVLAAFFLMLSRAKPLATLAAARPRPSALAPAVLLSVVLQFAVHLAVLGLVLEYAGESLLVARAAAFESEYAPSTLNTVVFLLGTSLMVVNLVVNYRGEPFMQGLRASPALWRMTLLCSGGLALLASGALPGMEETFEMSALAPGVRAAVCVGAIVDAALCLGIERLLR